MAKKNLTEGSMLGNIAGFSLPYLLAYFMQLLYGLADLYIIGLYCDVASTTAVAVGSQVMHFLTVIIIGLAMGTTVMVARAVGAGDDNKAAATIGNTVSLFIVFSIILSIVLLFIVNPIARVMATPSEAMADTVKYLTICFIGIPFITAYNVIASIYRGIGDSRSPMVFVAIACVLNIALDLLFIGPMHMGPSGAALGTTLSQTFSVLAALAYSKIRGLGIKVSGKDLRPGRKVLGSMLNIGIPIALQDGFVQVGFLIITIIANSRGLNDAAAVGIVEKVICMLFLVPSAMLSTISTMTAQCVGAKLYDRGRKAFAYAMGIALTYGLLVTVVMQFAAEATVGAFTDSAEVTRLGGQYLRSYSSDTFFAGCHFCFSGYFVAYGYSIVSFIHNCVSIMLARVPLSYLLSTNYPDTLFPMGMAAPIGSLLSSIICVGFYIFFRRRGKL